MKKVLLIVLLFAAAALGYWRWSRTAHAPAGQPPLATIGTSLDTFAQRFNDASDRTRLVVLLSPT